MATLIPVPSSFSFFGLSFSNFSRYLKALVYFSPAFNHFFSLNCALPIALRSSAISILFGMVKSWISSGQIGYLSPVPSSSNFWALWTYQLFENFTFWCHSIVFTRSKLTAHWDFTVFVWFLAVFLYFFKALDCWHSFYNLAEYNMFTIQMWCRNSRYKELWWDSLSSHGLLQ